MRKCLNDKCTTGNSWLVTAIADICSRNDSAVEHHSFVFENGSEAARWNAKIIANSGHRKKIPDISVHAISFVCPRRRATAIFRFHSCTFREVVF